MPLTARLSAGAVRLLVGHRADVVHNAATLLEPSTGLEAVLLHAGDDVIACAIEEREACVYREECTEREVRTHGAQRCCSYNRSAGQ